MFCAGRNSNSRHSSGEGAAPLFQLRTEEIMNKVKAKHWNMPALEAELRGHPNIRKELLLNLRTVQDQMNANPEFGHMWLDQLIRALEQAE
jgi:hypothetical protein